MEHFIRVCFGIVTLSLLQAKPTTIPSTDWRINLMRDRVNCSEDLKLYTPQNVKNECLTAALGCFLRELIGVVKEECEGNMRSTNQTVRALGHRINATEHGHASPQSCERECEEWPKTSFTEFLNHFSTLIKQDYFVALT